MDLRFKLEADKLNEALEIVSIVPPRPITPQGGAGYLFIVRGQTCYIYSRDSLHVARAQVDLTEVEGEGAFIYPSTSIEPFKYLNGQVIEFSAKTGDNGSYLVSYEASGGAGEEKTAFDPKLMQSCDKDLESAGEERSFPVAILRDAIAASRGFLAKPNDQQKVEENYKTLQIFDTSKPEWERGKGYLFASNATQAFFFYCEAFEGAKGLAIHVQHLSYVTSFLAKANGKVTFKTGQNMTFAIDEKDNVIGWTHHSKTHGKFSYYQLKMDQWVLAFDKAKVLSALKYTKSTMDSKREKIRLIWTNADKTLRFQVTEGNGKSKSWPVVVEKVKQAEERDFAFNANIDHMIALFDGAKGNEIDLRIYIRPGDERVPKDRAMFRSIDEFLVDADGRVIVGSPEAKPEGSFQCRITRFTPSMD